MRRILLSAALAIAASSLALSQTKVSQLGYSQNSNVSISTRCLAAQLSVRRVSHDAGAGNRAINFAFTNTSLSPCTLKGYPRVVPLDRAGRTLRGVRVLNDEGTYFQPEQAAEAVTLEPGKTAWFQIAFNAIQSTAKRCPVSARIRITAPDTRRAFVLREQMELCQRTIRVTPVRSGLPDE
jgi:hypothetical protein